MTRCLDCKWYKPFGAEGTDQCLHEKAESRIGGIRTEFTVTHRTCEVMIAARCEGHKLFEVAATGTLQDEYPDKYAGLKADAVREGTI